MIAVVVSTQYKPRQSAKLPRSIVERYFFGIPYVPLTALVIGCCKSAMVSQNGCGAVGAKPPLRIFHGFYAHKAVKS